MYQRSTVIVPLLRSCRRLPQQVQSRNVWQARDLILDMERQMENFERNFFRNFERNFFRNNPLRIITPRFLPIEGKETPQDSSYRINIDVQGFKPEDINISLKEGVLKIEAHMDKEAEDGSRFQQSIVRQFTLPPNVELSSVKSLLHEDGILSIVGSVNKQNQPKDIPIKHIQEGEQKKE